VVGSLLGTKMGNKIKDLPLLERPREKAMRYGIKSLSNEELLAMIIASGSKGNSARDIAYNLLSNSNGLFNLSNYQLCDFLKYKGIHKTKALLLLAVFEISKRIVVNQKESEESDINSSYLFEKYSPLLRNEYQECISLIMLDRYQKIIHEETLAKGGQNSVPFSLNDICRELLNKKARYFYLIHNHPSGDFTPSTEDIMLTEQLIIEVKKFGITLLDHLIISNSGYYSFKEGIFEK